MRQIFVNLPVADVAASREFFAKLGFTFNETFSDHQTASMVVEENIVVMLLEHKRFQDFITGDIAPRETTEVITCLSAASREEVDRLVAAALAAGGSEWQPAQDHGFMYGHSFRDLDGHAWELAYMDMDAMPQG
ncbi:putative lactoylglutathione lyase [Crossiella equi]|uniref:Lactoylglutathione lyase n=1 Tax=Crossiella equi TaxID=130796 RepID=A0ABS5ANI8_9PSEU|nr:VOC family protein [Crossiella equi]MBP2478121.1 putative lactoylglutathione lyase [Crossiella equi]